MPISLQAYSRRDFMQTVVAATAGWVTIRTARGDSSGIDPNYFVLMADTHIGVTPGTIGHGQNMYNNLQTCVQRILSNSPLPAGVIINGDCSFNIGERDSYVHLKALVQPLVDAGIAVHMSMGNHDHRANFYSVFDDMQPDPNFVDGRHILILDTEHAYMFILDSLIHAEDRDTVKGEFGEAQLAWLDDALGEHDDKPVHVFAHHYPNDAGIKSDTYGNGIEDQFAFFGVLSSHSQVESYIFGHAHIWDFDHTHAGRFELLGQPATGYKFRAEQPRAYLHANLSPRRMDLKLETIDTSHAWQGQEYTLAKPGRVIGMR